MRVALFALTVAAALAVAGCGSSSGGKSPLAVASPAGGAASTAAADSSTGGDGYGYRGSSNAGSTAADSLKIAGFAFGPNPLTVAPGQVVSVSNADSVEHTATSDQAGLFVGDDIKPGKTVTFKAPTRVGTYTFHCEYHPSMHGTLVVK
jgi:plastocyanin